MRELIISIRAKIVFTLLCGVIYPLAMTLTAKIFFPARAGGSLVRKGGEVVGSRLLAQEFKGERYFWPRPSAVGYNPIPSGGTNLGPTSKALLDRVAEAKQKGAGGDMLYASGSGLDPDISPASAMAQVGRVAQARKREEHELRALVLAHVEKRQFGFLGEERVNVLELNLALDR